MRRLHDTIPFLSHQVEEDHLYLAGIFLNHLEHTHAGSSKLTQQSPIAILPSFIFLSIHHRRQAFHRECLLKDSARIEDTSSVYGSLSLFPIYCPCFRFLFQTCSKSMCSPINKDQFCWFWKNYRNMIDTERKIFFVDLMKRYIHQVFLNAIVDYQFQISSQHH